MPDLKAEFAHEGEINFPDAKYEECPTPAKSAQDNNEYQVIKLKNGLRVLLISTKNASIHTSELEGYPDDWPGDHAKLAEIALCVRAGGFDDPEDYHGLAHLTEHALIRCSTKINIMHFLRERLGTIDASTEQEFTVFHVICMQVDLQSTMRLLGRQLSEPSFTAQDLKREIKEMDIEFNNLKKLQHLKKGLILSTCGHKLSPIRKFFYGNSHSLKDLTESNIEQQVTNFWEKHYSGDKITVVVKAEYSLRSLKMWATMSLQDIPLRPEIPLFETPDEFYNRDLFRKVFLVEASEESAHEVDVTFMLPLNSMKTRCRLENYLQFVMMYEGKGSLMSCFRKRQWAISLNASHQLYLTLGYLTFTVSICLLDQGIKDIERVLAALFSYAKLWQQPGAHNQLFKEFQKSINLQYQYSNVLKKADSKVHCIAKSMHMFDSVDYLRGEIIFPDDPYETIQSMFAKMSPSEANIMISSDEMLKWHRLDKLEPWCGTRYACIDTPMTWCELWRDLNPAKYELSIPLTNSYMPANLSPLSGVEGSFTFPVCIVNSDKMELWYKLDESSLPYSHYFLHFITPVALQSDETAVLTDVFITVLNQLMKEEAYSAMVAHYRFHVSTTERGFLIHIEGFNENLDKFLRTVLCVLREFNERVTESIFLAAVVEAYGRYVLCCSNPTFLAHDFQLSLLGQVPWTEHEKCKRLNGMSLDRLKQFKNKMMRQLFVQSLIQGNLSKESALATIKLLDKDLPFEALPGPAVPLVRIIVVPKGENVARVKMIGDDAAPFCSIVNYYQGGQIAKDDFSAIEVFVHMIQNSEIDTSSFENRLGSTVQCEIVNRFGVVGVNFTTETCSCTIDESEQIMKDYVRHCVLQLENLTEKKLFKITDAITKAKHVDWTQPKDNSTQNWNEILQGEHIFKRPHFMSKSLMKLKVEDVVRTIKRFFRDDYRLLSIQIMSVPPEHENYNSPPLDESNKKDKFSIDNVSLQFVKNDEKHYITDVSSFKQGSSLFPATNKRNPVFVFEDDD